MITKWKVSNFKSIAKETELELAPLTIFAGANSSGKSSFIQTILLVAQTLSNKVDSRSVVLNGALTSLGQFDDLKFENSEIEEITISCTCKIHDSADKRFQIFRSGEYYFLDEVSFEVSFDANTSNTFNKVSQTHPKIYSTLINSVFKDDKNLFEYSSISIVRNDIPLITDKKYDSEYIIEEEEIEKLKYDVELDEKTLDIIMDRYISTTIIGCQLKHFLPNKFTSKLDIFAEISHKIGLLLKGESHAYYGFKNLQNIIEEIYISEHLIKYIRDSINKIDSKVATDFYDSIKKLAKDRKYGMEWNVDDVFHILREYLARNYDVIVKSFSAQKSVENKIYEMLKLYVEKDKNKNIDLYFPTNIDTTVDYIEKYFRGSFKYLGPLRESPKPVYSLNPDADPSDVGIRGENTAAVLDLHKQKKIRYLPPENFSNSKIDRKTIVRTLEHAVIDWLKYLRISKVVESIDQGKLGHELKVGQFETNNVRDLTHVGVGVSQVLPILIMGLLTDTDSTLVFEQPELHLHPKVQFLLADFFLSLALTKRQCIVETHSEYIIDRIRRRVAESSLGDELFQESTIYFVENKSDGSSFRKLKINEFGTIPDWPDDFFDHSQIESDQIFEAAMTKREMKKRKEND